MDNTSEREIAFLVNQLAKRQFKKGVRFYVLERRQKVPLLIEVERFIIGEWKRVDVCNYIFRIRKGDRVGIASPESIDSIYQTLSIEARKSLVRGGSPELLAKLHELNDDP